MWQKQWAHLEATAYSGLGTVGLCMEEVDIEEVIER